MRGKLFKIMCSSNEHLTAETIAMALLRQISAETKKSKIFFAVREMKVEKNQKCSIIDA